MNVNVGSLDRIIRLVAALVLATLFFSGTLAGTAGVFALVAAGVLLVTSLVRFCPAYAVCGTRGKQKEGQECCKP